MTTANIDKKAIQDWLQQAVAQELKTPPEQIDIHQPFSSYRLDSVVVVTLAVDLETYLGCTLDPSIFWEFDTIADMSAWLVNEYLPAQNA